MTIHRRIKERREALGLSLVQVAEELGVTWQAVQQWEEEGGTAPRRTRMEQVAKVLQTTVEYLQTGRDPSGGNLSPREYQMICWYRGLPEAWREKAENNIRDLHELHMSSQSHATNAANDETETNE